MNMTWMDGCSPPDGIASLIVLDMNENGTSFPSNIPGDASDWVQSKV